MWAGEDWPQTHLKSHRNNVSLTGGSQSGCHRLIGGIQGLAYFLWQQVDVLFVSSLRSAVQLYQSQGLRGQVSLILTQMTLDRFFFCFFFKDYTCT